VKNYQLACKSQKYLVYKENAGWDGRFTASVEKWREERKVEAQVAAVELLDNVVEVDEADEADEADREKVRGDFIMCEMDGYKGE